MTTVHGFEPLRECDLAELRAKSCLYRHVKTGAQLLSICAPDENKVFGIAFRTPPRDSTGVAHILEHSVLCGSRKFPVKEPFVELLKGSLHTFLNAFTFPDKTVYPVASQNARDFHNLIEVYVDAVFHPLLTRHIFEQEGWHYEVEHPEEPLRYKGVVHNEMKGAYSSPDRLLNEYSQHSLFPESPYGVDSGGHPRHIPALTCEQLRQFHRTYYHPSNSRIYFYGDDDPETRLKVLDTCLRDFEAAPVDSTIPRQRPFEAPRRLVRTYDVGPDTDPKKRGMVTVNWLLPETADPEANFALRILAHILIGTPASPLRKALIESGLGEDLAGVGLESEIRQMFFSTGLRGITVEDYARVETLIFDVLRRLARGGIDPHTVEASLNTVEFRLRENNTGSFPRGLALMLRSLTTWLYDGNPFALLAFEAPLAAVKQRIASGERWFERLIDEHFLRNPHRTTLTLRPERGLGEREAARETETLRKARQSMTPADLDSVLANTQELKRLQATPDPAEALATIPRLELSDLEREVRRIPITRSRFDGAEILYHDLFTNGIVYVDIGFNVHVLPQERLPYLPLFGRALLEMGTEKENYVTLLQRIGRKTGGIQPQALTSSIRDAASGAAWFFLRGKAMVPQAEELLNIIAEMLTGVRFDQRERFRQLLLEEKASFEAGLVNSGHRVIMTRLGSRFSEADWAAEQMGGVSYLFFLRRLVERVETDWPGVLAALEGLRNALVNRRQLLCNLTVSGENWGDIETRIRAFVQKIPLAEMDPVAWSPDTVAVPEGLTVPAQVNFVGKAANLYRLGYRYHGSSAVVARFLSRTWLWDRVRVQGGAYGGFCSFDHRCGVFAFGSYRDPNLLETLEVYDRAGEYLRSLDLSKDELTKAVIGTIGDMDAYQLPDAKGYVSMVRYLTGETDEIRQQRRDEVLSATPSDFQAFGEVLAGVKDGGLVAVLGSPTAIEAANAARGGWLTITKVL